jgi:hypothetical protein
MASRILVTFCPRFAEAKVGRFVTSQVEKVRNRATSDKASTSTLNQCKGGREIWDYTLRLP